METEEVPILRITEQDSRELKDTVTLEFSLTITLNQQELATLLCSPTKLDYLAIGFLASEGLIKSKGEIEKITVDEDKGTVQVIAGGNRDLSADINSARLIASSGGRGTTFQQTIKNRHTEIQSHRQVTASEVYALMAEFTERSKVFKATGGVHSAALCDNDIIVFSEDIGRHNALDKVLGECLWQDLPTEDRILVTSGRISSEILLKAAQRNIPILVSKSAPTNMGVKLATDLGMTLIGFVRGRRMNIYSCAWRVLTDAE